MSDEYDKPILIQIQTWFILVELNGIWTYFPLGMSKTNKPIKTIKDVKIV